MKTLGMLTVAVLMTGSTARATAVIEVGRGEIVVAMDAPKTVRFAAKTPRC